MNNLTLIRYLRIVSRRERQAWYRSILLLLIGMLLIGTASAPSFAAGQQPASIPHNVSNASNKHLEELGVIPGLAARLAAQPGLALVAGEKRLSILNTVDPAHPRFVGMIDLPILIRNAAIAGNYAYVLGEECSNPILMMCEDSLIAVDLSDPSTPMVAGMFSTSHAAVGPVVFGSIALIADSDYHIDAPAPVVHIMDISKPGQLTEIGTIPDSLYALHITLAPNSANQHLYAYISKQDHVEVYDLINPHIPSFIGNINTGIGISTFYSGNGSNVVYSCSCDSSDLHPTIHIIDFSDGQHPVDHGTMPIIPKTYQIATAGDLLFTSTETETLVYNLTQPLTPTLSSRLPLGGYAQPVLLDATHILLAGKTSLHVFDTSNLVAPTQVFDIKTVAPSDTKFYGQTIYVPSNGEIPIFDIANPAAPQATGALTGTLVTIPGDYAITFTSGKLRVNSISGATPVELSSTEIPFQFRREVALKSYGIPGTATGYAYLAGNETITMFANLGEFYVFDLTNSAAPIQAAYLPMTEGVVGMDIAYPYAYLVTAKGALGSEGSYLHIIDLSQPSTPVIVGSLTLPSQATGITIDGVRAYVGTSNQGVQFIDISQPVNPQIIGAFMLPETPSAQSVVAEEGLLYAITIKPSTGNGMLSVIDPTDPSMPQIIAQHPTFQRGGLAIQDGLITISSSDGLDILRYGTTSGAVVDTLGMPVAGTAIHHQNVPTGSGFTGSFAVNTTATSQQALQSDLIIAELQGYTSWPPSRSLSEASNGTANFTMLASPVTTSISPNKGATASFTDPNGATTSLQIEGGIFNAPATLSITPTIAPALTQWAFAGHAFDLHVTGSASSQPFATVTIAYSAAEIRLVSNKAQLTLRRWDGLSWRDAAADCTPAAIYTRDLAHNTLRLPLCQTGRYALFGPTNRTFLPFVSQ